MRYGKHQGRRRCLISGYPGGHQGLPFPALAFLIWGFFAPPPMLVTSQIGNPGTWLECHSLSWQDLDKPLPLSKAHWLFWQMRALD